MSALPPFARTALLLDLDGTLLDLAPTPDSVVVPASLPADLARLCHALDGALAVITGRPVAQIDALLPGIVPAVAGEHGGAIRAALGAPLVRVPAADLPPGLAAAASAIADAHGATLEIKARGFVLHYRLVPAAGPALHTALAGLMAPVAGFELMSAAMAWEVRPRGIDKGRAVDAVMALPAFIGRLPLFLGDDVTDRDAIAAAARLGGMGLFVPDSFGTPAKVRAWLAASVRTWAPLSKPSPAGGRGLDEGGVSTN